MASDVSTSRKQFWEEHIAQWRATALSQGEYCFLQLETHYSKL